MQAELDLVFLWHMHQPDYRSPDNGDYAQPWVYLHALKDYSDMAAHLERHANIRAVVNFVPVLLEQIEDYVRQLSSDDLRDPLLRLLSHPDPEAWTPAERRLALATCFRSNDLLMIKPFPAYQRLRDLFLILEGQDDRVVHYLSGSYFADLVTWYHLVWTGEAMRRQHSLLADMMSRGAGYTLEDRLALLELIRVTLKELIPRYRALAERGQIELSSTPYAHPLAPLLLDFHSAREAIPELPLPQSPTYPGGRDRIDAHLSAAFTSHQSRFGAPPAGIWPAEGAISNAFISRLAAHGCRWTGSGEAVLAHSLDHAGQGYEKARDLYRPYRLAAAEPLLFFRDDRLSDLIGFEYAKWHGKDAVHNFIAELDAIRQAAPEGERPLVSVILDGENAWEFYPFNGYYFFEGLYRGLDEQAGIHTTTFADCLADPGQMARVAILPELVAGSWVYGTLTTWIGDPEKNHAWDLLCAVKQGYDLVINSGRLDPESLAAAKACLTVCESSDWFWWLGDYNPPEAVAQFEELFRRNLRRLYQLIRLSPPEVLQQPLSRGGGAPEVGGTMRRSTESSET